jgi:cytochrome c oxidase cbb3-type subunit III
MRQLVLLLLPLQLAAQQPGLSRFGQDKAVALFRDQLPCLGCHELNGEGSRLAPSLTTVSQRRNAAYIRAIVQAPQSVVPGSAMPKTPMSPATRETIVRYLARNAADGSAPAAQTPPRIAGSAPIASLYQRWCASCHGPTGGGDGPNARFLPVKPAVHRDAGTMGALSDDTMFDAIAGGGAVMGKSPRMPAFGETLTSTDIRALVTYIRALCSCSGPSWSRASLPR